MSENNKLQYKIAWIGFAGTVLAAIIKTVSMMSSSNQPPPPNPTTNGPVVIVNNTVNPSPTTPPPQSTNSGIETPAPRKEKPFSNAPAVTHAKSTATVETSPRLPMQAHLQQPNASKTIRHPVTRDIVINEGARSRICGDIFLKVKEIYIDDTGFPGDKIIVSWTGSQKEGKPLEIGAPPLTISDACAVQVLKTDLGSHSRFAKLKITQQVKGDEND